MLLSSRSGRAARRASIGPCSQRLHGQIALDLRRAADARAAAPGCCAPGLTALDSEPGPAGPTWRRCELRASPAVSAVALSPRQKAARQGAASGWAALRPADLLLGWDLPSGSPRAMRASAGGRRSSEPWRRFVLEGGPGTNRTSAGPWIARRSRRAPDLFDDETWHSIATRNVQMARGPRRPWAVLPLALNLAVVAPVASRESLLAAAALIEESLMGSPRRPENRTHRLRADGGARRLSRRGVLEVLALIERSEAVGERSQRGSRA